MTSLIGRTVMRLLLIVDDWEALERYENELAGHFELLSAPFGEMGIDLAREEKPDLLFVDLTFEDMTPAEARKALTDDEMTARIPAIIVGEGYSRPFTY